MRLDKADQLLCYMNQAPIGPGFVSEVEAFLSDTGIGHRRFGSSAAGDPLFVMKLRTGATPRLSTVEQVQAWMRANRNALEHAPGAQGQGDGEQSLPDRSSDAVRPRGTTVFTKDGPQVILTTREAAALLTLSLSTLERYRMKGGGPRYLQFGAAVRYARADLLEWVLTMRRDGTPEE